MFALLFAAATAALAVPPERQTAETIERRVVGAFPLDGKLFILPLEKAFVVRSPWVSAGKTRAESFGKMTDAERLTVTKVRGSDFRGADLAENKILLMDAEQLTLVETDPEKLTEVTRRSVAWDLLKPPPDPRGEPTSLDVAKTRARFKKEFLKTSPPRFVGLARVPSGFLGTKGRSYVVATRLPGFPFVVMSCVDGDASACQVVRHCHVEKADGLRADAVSGIGVSAKQHEILIGDSREHAIRVFNAKSCYNVPQVRMVALPAKIKKLTNLHVDADERLWVTTDMPDDYLNASVFFWDSW